MSTFNIQVTPQNNTLLVIDNDQNQVVVTNPITSVVEVVSQGPQGPVGPMPNTSSLISTSSFNNFTSSYNTGSFTGSFVGQALINSPSGLIIPNTSSGIPTFTGTDGQFVFGTDAGNYYLYVWMNGNWRSGSLN